MFTRKKSRQMSSIADGVELRVMDAGEWPEHIYPPSGAMAEPGGGQRWL